MDTRKIVLFFPNTGFDIVGVSVDLPLALLYLAAYLRDEFNVVLIDQRVEPGWRERLEEELRSAPLCFGVSSMTCPQILFGLEASAMVRKLSPETLIVWGGVHPTLMAKETLTNALVDVVVRDEGEVPFLELCRALAKDRRADLGKLPSLSFVRDGRCLATPPAFHQPPIDSMPPLPYDLLKAGVPVYIGSQGRFEDPDAKSLIMLTSRGCPYRCTFCTMPGMPSSRTWKAEDPNLTIKHVGELIDVYGIDAVAFHDEEFAINPDRVRRLGEAFKSEFGGRGRFRWWIQARMDSLLRLKEDLPLLVESGLESLQPGIESGSDRILALIKKKETVATHLEANRALREVDLRPLYNFMLGFPTETIDEMKATLRLACELLDENPKAMVSGVYVAVPYPGTELYDEALKHGFRPPQSLEEWAEFNRQQLLTPWVKVDPEKLAFTEFAKLTSRMVDGKRLPLRLGHAFGGLLPFAESQFRALSERLKRQWRAGDTSDVEMYRTVNDLVLSLFGAAERFEPAIRSFKKSAHPVMGERDREWLETVPIGGPETNKDRDPEYRRAKTALGDLASLPQRSIENPAPSGPA